ncbi:MAG: hypothetical protein ABI459_07105, partial [Deltaproteobacteria bacterium]
LPQRASDYGFELDVGEAVYEDIITRLNANGVIAPDIMTALRGAPETGELPLFGADFHWSSEGAKLAAEAIGAMIKADPSYADATPKAFETEPAGVSSSFSAMRLGLQTFCVDALPPVETMTYETTEVASMAPDDGALDIGLGDAPADAGEVDIFGNVAADKHDVVLVGTSFSDSDVNNFAGFIEEYSGLEVINYAVTGGNQFGAITSYMSSREFRDSRPEYLIWESPIYNNLAGFGPSPMEELISLAGEQCGDVLKSVKADTNTLTADFGAEAPGPKDMVYIDFGAEGPRRVDVKLTTKTGIIREGHIERGDRLRATGLFSLWLEPYWLPGLASVEVKFDRALEDGASISVCRNLKGNNL